MLGSIYRMDIKPKYEAWKKKRAEKKGSLPSAEQSVKMIPKKKKKKKQKGSMSIRKVGGLSGKSIFR